QAVWGMIPTLTPDRPRVAIAVIALIATLLLAGSLGQVAAITVGAIGGLFFCRATAEESLSGASRFRVRRGVGVASLVVFVLLLAFGPVLASMSGGGGVALFDTVYRAGAL